MKRFSPLSLIIPLVVPLAFSAKDASAVPAFARKYQTACSTCHLAFPVRNGFGEAFRNNGYRFPGGQDEDMVKETPIELGKDAYKNVFPNAIWPSDLPAMPSLGFLARVSASTAKSTEGKYTDSNYEEEIDIFFAGTVTPQISYIGDMAIGPNKEPAKLGRLSLLWTFKPGVTMAFGTVGFPERFDIISTTAGGDSNGFAAQMPNPNKGVELRLTGDTGSGSGYSLIAGFGRNSQTDGASIPPVNESDDLGNTSVIHTYDQNNSTTGGNFGDTKYARASFKLGGNGLLSGAGGTFGNNYIGLDNSIVFGVNYLSSSSGTNVDGADYVVGLSNTVYGGDVTISYGNIRLLGQYTRFNEITVNETIQEVVNGIITTSTSTSNNYGKRNTYSLEADYWLYPWLFGVVRYEHLKDSFNGSYAKVIPGVGALLRPNFKVGVEYVNVANIETWNTNYGASPAPTKSWNFFAQLGF